MAVSRGKVHKYLGTTLDYTVRGRVKITRIDNVDEILTAFDKAEPNGGGKKTSAAPENLFRLWCFTTWWPRLCTPPNEPDRIPVLPSHS